MFPLKQLAIVCFFSLLSITVHCLLHWKLPRSYPGTYQLVLEPIFFLHHSSFLFFPQATFLPWVKLPNLLPEVPRFREETRTSGINSYEREPQETVILEMAEGTRISKLDGAVQKLLETSYRQQQLVTELLHKVAAMDGKFEQIFLELRREREETQVNSSGNRSENCSGGRESNQGPSNWISSDRWNRPSRMGLSRRAILFLSSDTFEPAN